MLTFEALIRLYGKGILIRLARRPREEKKSRVELDENAK